MCNCCRDMARACSPSGSDTPAWSCCPQNRNCSVNVSSPMPAWLLCTEQHWPGAPWGHGVRPVPPVPGERVGHQLQVPRLQVFEGCTEVSRVGCWAGSLLSQQWEDLGLRTRYSVLSQSQPRSWCSVQVCYFKRWRSIVLKVNCGICRDAACSKNLSRSP